MDNENNILCWCRSGKRLRECHLVQSGKKPLTFSEIHKKRQKIWKKEYCLHPEKAKCSRGFIKAHTVQRSMLKKISIESHVYTPVAHPTPNQLEIYMKRVGIGDASVFTGFCALHDKETFAPIEDADFTGAEEQSFLYAYRALCRELYARFAQQRQYEFHLSSTEGKSFNKLQWDKQFFDRELAGIQADIKDLTDLKTKMDDILLSKNFNDFHHCVFWLDQTPDLLCNGRFQPDFDFFGNRLQDLNQIHKRHESISLSFITTEKAGAVVLAWDNDSDTTCQALINSLLSFSDSRMPDLLVNWAVKELENIFFSPAWWESKSRRFQQRLMDDFLDHPALNLRPRFSNYLTSGLKYGFSWKVEKITSNFFKII